MNMDIDMDSHDDKRVLVLAPQDNCVIACTTLPAGTVLQVDGQPLTVVTAIEVGHKLARHAIVRGEKLIRHGAAIGTATKAIARGDHVHLHNLKSDYLPTYTVGQPGAVAADGAPTESTHG